MSTLGWNKVRPARCCHQVEPGEQHDDARGTADVRANPKRYGTGRRTAGATPSSATPTVIVIEGRGDDGEKPCERAG